jgi:hypothetical protein
MELTDEYTWIVDPIDGMNGVTRQLLALHLGVLLISTSPVLSRYLQVRGFESSKQLNHAVSPSSKLTRSYLLLSVTSFVHTL